MGEPKSNSDMTNKIFEHKNIFATTTKLPSCVNINEDDFLSLDFEFDIPEFVNDFIEYMTGGLLSPHRHIVKENQKQKYLERMNATSPTTRSTLNITFTQQDLDSVKFWSLVDHSEPKRDESGGMNIKDYEKYKIEKRNKKAHILPLSHEHLHLKGFLTYFKKSHVNNLERSFILLAHKEVNENSRDIYITEQSMIDGFHKVGLRYF